MAKDRENIEGSQIVVSELQDYFLNKHCLDNIEVLKNMTTQAHHATSLIA